MKIHKLITNFILFGGLSLYGQSTFGTAEGENAPQVGDIVPDSITFAMSTTPALELLPDAEALGDNFFFPNLENRSYSDFPNEVVITVYHTPW